MRIAPWRSDEQAPWRSCAWPCAALLSIEPCTCAVQPQHGVWHQSPHSLPSLHSSVPRMTGCHGWSLLRLFARRLSLDCLELACYTPRSLPPMHSQPVQFVTNDHTWGTSAMRLRRSCVPIVATSMPSIRICPEAGSTSLNSARASVDFPQPVRPAMPTCKQTVGQGFADVEDSGAKGAAHPQPACDPEAASCAALAAM